MRGTLLLLVAVLAAACTGESFSMSVSPAFSYPAAVDPSLERVAIVVTITNRSEDDLLVSPADFAARDRDHRVFPANPAATLADARAVTAAASGQGLRGVLPLPSITLRKDDVVSGFIVFDVPAGTRPAQLVFRQSDTDRVVELPAAR